MTQRDVGSSRRRFFIKIRSNLRYNNLGATKLTKTGGGVVTEEIFGVGWVVVAETRLGFLLFSEFHNTRAFIHRQLTPLFLGIIFGQR
jgi:hypothetical protein